MMLGLPTKQQALKRAKTQQTAQQLIQLMPPEMYAKFMAIIVAIDAAPSAFRRDRAFDAINDIMRLVLAQMMRSEHAQDEGVVDAR